MKPIPIIVAFLVTIGLYFFVLDRDALLRVAGAGPDIAAADAPAATPAEPSTIADTMQAAEDSAAHVRVVAVHSTAQMIENAVILRGRTEAAREVTVSSETSGQVISEPLRKGAYVNAGDLLCQLDPGTREAALAEARARLTEAQSRVPEAEAAVAEAEARVREAEINLTAAQRLSEDGFASETRRVGAEAQSESAAAGVQRARSGVESARAGIEAATAAVAAAEREIERLTVTAPFAGLLETDTAELGTLMQPGTPCATIVQLDPIKLVGFVPEADVGSVAVGAMTQARIAGGDNVTGRVTFLSRSADDSTRTFRVEVEVPNPDLAIRDGQTVEIVVAAEGRNAHLIPQSALTLNDDGDLGVRTLAEGNVAQFMPVTLLRDTAEGVWVSDLPAQADIIVVGQEFIVDGVVVDPTFEEAKG